MNFAKLSKYIPAMFLIACAFMSASCGRKSLTLMTLSLANPAPAVNTCVAGTVTATKDFVVVLAATNATLYTDSTCSSVYAGSLTLNSSGTGTFGYKRSSSDASRVTAATSTGDCTKPEDLESPYSCSATLSISSL